MAKRANSCPVWLAITQAIPFRRSLLVVFLLPLSSAEQFDSSMHFFQLAPKFSTSCSFPQPSLLWTLLSYSLKDVFLHPKILHLRAMFLNALSLLLFGHMLIVNYPSNRVNKATKWFDPIWLDLNTEMTFNHQIGLKFGGIWSDEQFTLIRQPGQARLHSSET